MSKTKIVAAVSAALVVLGTSGYFGKKYVEENYVILNQEDIAALEQNVNLLMMQAYTIGEQACNKNI